MHARIPAFKEFYSIEEVLKNIRNTGPYDISDIMDISFKQWYVLLNKNAMPNFYESMYFKINKYLLNEGKWELKEFWDYLVWL